MVLPEKRLVDFTPKAQRFEDGIKLRLPPDYGDQDSTDTPAEDDDQRRS